MTVLPPLTRSRHTTMALFSLVPLSALLLMGCAPETADDAPPATQAETAPAEQVTEEAGNEPEQQGARVQEESCDWEAAPLATSLPSIPSGQPGEISDAIVGSWQHTHIDYGSGYEAVEAEDLRFVFPTSDRMLYCQHVPGITDHASNAGDITWDGTTIVLPSGSAGYTVTAWNEDVMVWANEIVESTYLLQRR